MPLKKITNKEFKQNINPELRMIFSTKSAGKITFLENI